MNFHPNRILNVTSIPLNMEMHASHRAMNMAIPLKVLGGMLLFPLNDCNSQIN